MKNKNFILIIFLGIFSIPAFAQVNTDSLFQNAINLAKEKKYDQSISEAKVALDSDKNRGDILVFIANVCSWQGNNELSKTYLDKARELSYFSPDYYESFTNVLLRSGEFVDLLQKCDEAEKNNYPNKEDLLLKRMIARSGLKQYDEGVNLIEEPENKEFLRSEKIDNLYTDLLLKRNTHIISAFYSLDLLSHDFAPQQLASMGYSFKVGEHTWAFRANYANRFGMNDVQLESDFYWMLKNAHYMYFNYGYALNASLFPRHRVGLEYYFPLGNKFEGSIGGRYLNFPTSDVLIFTGHLGKYFGKSWVSVRPFYVYKLQDKTSSLSFIGNYRLYGKNALNYWGVEVGLGNSPDDIYSVSSGGFNQLVAYRIKLERNFMLNRVSDLHIGLGYAREEFGTITTQFRNRLTVELGYKLRLK
ncbi:MAG: YaiO family outer membrane beta-barrel protein [Paludibacter sp.]|nr:YaiO family outer membrane beta-barrel protein [Paludibacter sp.]